MLNFKTLISLLACVSVGVYAGPCKPITTKATSAELTTSLAASETTQVVPTTTADSTLVDLTTTISASETEASGASTTELSSQVTEKSTTVESSTTELTTTVSEASTTTKEATTTKETTTTTVATCPTPVSCNNLGLQWAYYNNPAVNNDATYSSFDPSSFKQDSPVYTGTTRQLGGLFQQDGATGNGATGPIYGSSQSFPLSHFALNHRGYLYTCEQGLYTFKIPYADDAIYAWVSGFSYAGWTKGNADANAEFNALTGTPGSTSFTVSLAAGVYIPIRFVYGEANYSGGFKFSITSPSGQVLASDSMAASPYLVQYSCDGVEGPQYPPFGQEI
ncbi:hypothetical protein NW762_013820 [Fusarium torreyae]|uniref:PA14 domain-containing protein n=1 Tax=Fusarium torreyae TaxID=1237075 RepID=A0A9W8VA30_9HYPO|nr:hypothetical protein NW762_013820 [Fusarium torreyae]